MRKFVVKLISAGLMLITIVICVYAVSISLVRSATDIQGNNLGEIVVLGNSLASNGIDPNLTKANITNFGLEGEPFFWTYFKAKIILLEGIKVDTFLIEITPTQFSEGYNPLYKEKLIGFIPRYLPYFNLADLREIQKEAVLSELIFAIRKSPVRWLKFALQNAFNSLDIFGAHKSKNGNYEPSPNISLETVDLSKGGLNVLYFVKLVDLLHRENKVVYLYHSPKPVTESKYWDELEDETDEIIINLFSSHSQQPSYLKHNYQRLPIFYFADKWHLNQAGSKLFSENLVFPNRN